VGHHGYRGYGEYEPPPWSRGIHEIPFCGHESCHGGIVMAVGLSWKSLHGHGGTDSVNGSTWVWGECVFFFFFFFFFFFKKKNCILLTFLLQVF
jgi:hypothetical protein